MRAMPLFRRATLAALIAGAALGLSPATAQERAVATAGQPSDIAVTVYRDPARTQYDELDRDNPLGFAMITEKRRVTLPPGQSTLRFVGVAEGMVAVTAIVTGLPGGTIEQNQDANLLSPASLVDGTLGNRVTVTRTNPATGEEVRESAIVRTQANGGLVLQTDDGYEAVRCSGVPERLEFDRVPGGLVPQPVFSVDTLSPQGGTYDIELTYLAWGFDWEATYVLTVGEGGRGSELPFKLLSWLTIVNDNGQTFPDARLMAVAGTLNVESDYEDLAEPPTAPPLRLTCYPIGSTATGSPVGYPPPPPPPPPPAPMLMEGEAIIVTGAKRSVADFASPVAVLAGEEQLGDLKLYRVPVPVTVSAKGQKQIAFLQREAVEARFLYTARCDPWERFEPDESGSDMDEASILLVTKNEERRGLGVALPMGGFTLFEPSNAGDLLVAEQPLRDYAKGQDVEIELGSSAQVFSQCARFDDEEPDEDGARWTNMRARFTNANPHAVDVRLQLAYAGEFEAKVRRAKVELKNGMRVANLRVPANSTREWTWRVRRTGR